MQALLLTSYRKLEIVDLPDPTSGEGEVVVDVRACGICGSDIHGYDGSSGRRLPPLVMGHEAAGIVSQIGPGVHTVQVGDRVTMDSTIYCGQCSDCRDGRRNLCEKRRVLGVSCAEYSQTGAFAEKVVVPARILYRLPDNLPFEQAAMIECVSVAVHAVRRLKIHAGDTGLVVGTGMIGLLIVQALKQAGCERVIAADVDDTRLSLACQLGATHAVDANDPKLSARIAEWTAGRMADVSCEVVGRGDSLQTAIASVRRGGQISLVGNIQKTVALPLQDVVTRELTLVGSCASNGEYPECIELVASGKICVAPLISQIAPLEDGPQLFDELYRNAQGKMKVILVPK